MFPTRTTSTTGTLHVPAAAATAPTTFGWATAAHSAPPKPKPSPGAAEPPTATVRPAAQAPPAVPAPGGESPLGGAAEASPAPARPAVPAPPGAVPPGAAGPPAVPALHGVPVPAGQASPRAAEHSAVPARDSAPRRTDLGAAPAGVSASSGRASTAYAVPAAPEEVPPGAAGPPAVPVGHGVPAPGGESSPRAAEATAAPDSASHGRDLGAASVAVPTSQGRASTAYAVPAPAGDALPGAARAQAVPAKRAVAGPAAPAAYPAPGATALGTVPTEEAVPASVPASVPAPAGEAPPRAAEPPAAPRATDRSAEPAGAPAPHAVPVSEGESPLGAAARAAVPATDAATHPAGVSVPHPVPAVREAGPESVSALRAAPAGPVLPRTVPASGAETAPAPLGAHASPLAAEPQAGTGSRPAVVSASHSEPVERDRAVSAPAARGAHASPLAAEPQAGTGFRAVGVSAGAGDGSGSGSEVGSDAGSAEAGGGVVPAARGEAEPEPVHASEEAGASLDIPHPQHEEPATPRPRNPADAANSGVPGPGVAEIVAQAVARGMEEADTLDLPKVAAPHRGTSVTEVPVHLPFRGDAASAPPRPEPTRTRKPAAPARTAPGRRVPRSDDRLREHRGPVLPGWVGVAVGGLALAGCTAVLWRAGIVPAPLVAAFGAAPRAYRGLHAAHWPPLAFLGIVALVALGGLGRVRTGHAWVLTLFGRYRGTVRRTGLTWVSPLLLRSRVDVRLRHWRSDPMPAVDSDGLALQVVVQVVWQVEDTARATLAVADHTEYLAEQVESAMARVLSQLPADAFHDDTPTLRDAEAVGDALTRMLAAETEAVGIEVYSAQPTRIEYAPEVAEAMRRRRVAAIDAKHRDAVLTSVVDAVDDTVHRLTSRGLVELDDYERKALVKDLTVAFCTGRTE
ncbi:SPFH domain-containing protein [Streptomyces sp. NPDC060232]|uniref:SPFH domain-containing protein n=1 Tax=Streptomyces sp. NPDC060232 TaxID=3347079 RepID=UPI003657DDFC